jgi:3-isopropylmalate dehydrogenase
VQAGTAIFDGIAGAIAAGEATKDVNGKLGTRETGAALVKRLLA